MKPLHLLSNEERNLFFRSAFELPLLERVAIHKSIYFASAWASYETARKGTLKLSPSNRVVGELKKDYDLMGSMFYGSERPGWDVILKAITDFEREFNENT